MRRSLALVLALTVLSLSAVCNNTASTYHNDEKKTGEITLE